jgi:hypothetical protein
MGDLGFDGRIILNEILKKCNVREWAGCNWLRTGSTKGFL